MRKICEVEISVQARLMLENMPEIKEEDFLEWYCNKRKVSPGSADLVVYLEYLKTEGGPV